MSSRSNISIRRSTPTPKASSSSALTSSSTPPISRSSSQNSQSRIVTSRGDIPSTSRMPNNNRRKGAPKSLQRREVVDHEDVPGSSAMEDTESGDALGNSSGGEDELLDLLGVASSAPPLKQQAEGDATITEKPQRGILPITGADLRNAKKNPRKKMSKTAPVNGRTQSQDNSNRPPASPTPKGKRNTSRPKTRAAQEPRTEMSEDDPTMTTTPIPQPPKIKNTKLKPKQTTRQAVLVQGVTSDLTSGDETPGKMADSGLLDLSALSQSLPSEGFFASPGIGKKGKGKHVGKGGNMSSKETGTGDESAVWEMPEGKGNGESADLTWQQKLGSYPFAYGTPTTKKKSTTTTTKKSRPAQGHISTPSHPSLLSLSKPSVPAGRSTPLTSFSQPTRPTHTRRASADSIPSAPSRKSAPSALSSATMSQIASFDQLPHHSSKNVHRAPQTPARLANGVVSELPLQGEFPRLKQGSMGVYPSQTHQGQGQPQQQQQGQAQGQGQMQIGPGGIKYAGPNFHNSPHASSLPKPDLDDF